MLTVFVILALVALILAVTAATGHTPLWASVIMLCIIELVRALPMGR